MPHLVIKHWLNAFTGLYTPDPRAIGGLDSASKFLYAARSVILIISAQAAIIAGLLAAGDRAFHVEPFIGILVGFVVAHMLSNLSNDYFGYRRGHDLPDSPRMRYTVHPLASGVLDQRTLLTGLAVLVVVGCSVAAAFVLARGWLAAAFLVPGVALLLWYDASPVPLKSVGLGEFAVLLVWGPLMIGGGYAMIVGHVSANAMFASVPYGLGVMTILVGKHIDKMQFDSQHRIRTLPVLLGAERARALNIVSIGLMYVIVAALVVSHRLTPFALVAVIALPRGWRAVRTMSHPRPASPPAGYVGWPLWYSRTCHQHGRLFGWAYIAGLSAGVAWSAVLG